MMRRLILTISLLFAALSGFAQNVKLYTTQDGLAGSLLKNIFVDSSSMVWVSSETGLNRYDGSNFVKYFHNPSDSRSLANNFVNSVFQDSRGNIFVCTHSGVQLYDPYTDSFSPLATIGPEQKPSGQISRIAESADGELWAAGNSVFRLELDGNRISLSELPQCEDIRFADYAAFDGYGNFWCVRFRQGVYRLDTDGVVHRYFADGGVSITDMCTDPSGNIYLASVNLGLLRYRSGSDDFERVCPEANSVSCVIPLSPRLMGIGTFGNGLYIFNRESGRVVRYVSPDERMDLKKCRITSLANDKSGNIWLCASTKGVIMVPSIRNSFGYIGHNSSSEDLIGATPVSKLTRSRTGEMLVATDGDGLYVLNADNRSSKHYSPGPGSVPSGIFSIFEDSRGDLWMGTFNGLVTIMDRRSGRCRYVDLESEIGRRMNSVSGFTEDSAGRIWLSTMGAGLVCYNPQSRKFIRAKAPNGRIPDYLTCVKAGSDGKLYIGSYDGAYCLRLDGEGWLMEISNSDIVHSINEQAPGEMAFGCDNGLLVWSEARGLRRFNTGTGLPDNTVYSVLRDNEGCTWLSSVSGISKLDADYGLVLTYCAEDGLMSGEFIRSAAWKDVDGTLWFGGINGLSYFNPSSLGVRDNSWNVRITGLYLGNSQVNGGMKSGKYTILDAPVYMADKAELSWKDNAFSLDLATEQHGAPSRLQFEYSLDGKDWTLLPQGSRRLSFSGLRPGKYKLNFRVLDNGVASDVRDFTVNVHPSPWASPLAKCIYVILLLVIASLSLLWERRHLKAKQQIREYQHAEQINESKLQFFVNISHELKNPLSLIMGPLKRLMSSDDDKTRQKYYKTMMRNCDRILSLMNQLLDIRKIDKGGMNLKFRRTDIVPYIQAVVDSYAEQYAVKHINLKFRHPGTDSLYIWLDPANFDKVLYNLLSNAYKFTPENGEVCVQLELSGRENVRIIVSDNGIGISDTELEKVFERFYQVSGAQSVYKGGAGVGLNLTRSLVELHHGEIHAEHNSSGQGTSFVITLPLGREHIKDEDILPEEKTLAVATPVPAVREEKEVREVPVHAPESDSEERDNPDRSPRTRIRVLLVDDDLELRKFVASELSVDFYIKQCGDGKEALEEIFRKAPDVVVSDIMMPVMDGIRLCDKIKSNININSIPVILLTGKTGEQDNIEGLKTGADAYITKPFSLDLLKTTIINLFESRRRLRNSFSGNQNHNEKLSQVKVGDLDQKLMDRIMKAIDSNISNPNLTIEMLANEVGISRVHLHRKLKQLTNQTTSDFVRNTRLALAAKILCEGKYSIAEVAAKVGFESQSNFSTAFKKLYGVTPREYMKQQE